MASWPLLSQKLNYLLASQSLVWWTYVTGGEKNEGGVEADGNWCSDESWREAVSAAEMQMLM